MKFCFNGLNQTGHIKYGKPFDCSLYSGLKQLNLLDSNIKDPLNGNIKSQLKKPIIVTSVNAENYGNLANFIAEVGRFYENSTIVIYDLGMEQKQVIKSRSQVINFIFRLINSSLNGVKLFTRK